MNKHVVAYAVAVVAVGALLVLVVPGMMRQTPEDQIAQEPSQEQQAAQVAPRPECGARGVAGVELSCLGAQPQEQQQTQQPDLSAEGVAVVNVWAWWCAPCREELPLMERFAQEHPEYRVVGVHADAKAAAGAELLNELDVDLPSFQDGDNSFAGALGLPSVVPITVVVRDGEVAGVLPKAYADMTELERDVREALA
ncbi:MULTISPECIES: TlpA disulfide reductase family protein [unclassified Corynebacterium]|uniref:TlpA family protein disulfide reductase n=1 Tax=unclassified Corynebacterium TaxID=2624378 RepID=UPI0029C9DAAC|nr:MULTISPECIES: TlpA disulfide reductase family protein [unclassified Corynebacterium]WPF66311.1 TlpA disulfide reductase family protein [Corynebacterium sp. 22KM0430]WPF68801.1 TlpA disulfide reductase family protein [Corynebacterium sp. 21KM1197]